MVGYAGSPIYTAYVDMTLTRSKVKIKVTGLLNFRQLAKPCMLAAMTAAPLRGFLVLCLFCVVVLVIVDFCCVRFSFFHTKPRDGLGKRLRNDLFCVEWDVKPQLSSINLEYIR